MLKTSLVSSLAVAGLTSLAAMLTPSAAMAGTFSYSGDLTGQPTFNRPEEGDPPTIGIVGSYPYQTQSFTVDTTGSGYEATKIRKITRNGAHAMRPYPNLNVINWVANHYLKLVQE